MLVSPALAMRTYNCVLLLCVFLLDINGFDAAPWKLIMQPHLSIYPRESVFHILCESDPEVPLHECGFQVNYDAYYDMSNGSETSTRISPHYTLEYYGDGLSSGQCGMKFTALPSSRARICNIGCRARTKNGEWIYDYTTVLLSLGQDIKSIPFTVQPRHEVVLPGSDMSTVFRVNEPLRYCNIKPPDSKKELSFRNGASSSSATGHYEYYGRGLAHGECGLTVFNATENDNEWIVFRVETKSGKIAKSTSLFPVAKPPTLAPQLNVLKSELDEGDFLEAECSVELSRPPANITWYIGRYIVSCEQVEDVPNQRWKWKIDAEERRQKVKLQVFSKHDRNMLTCEASHVGMKTKLRTSKLIRVKKSTSCALVCGQRRASPTLVASGRNSGLGEFPWQAGLYGLIAGKFTHFCGGTLITPNTVVTAAHCIYNEISQSVQNKSDIKVVLGKLLLDWDVTAPDSDVQRRDVAEMITYHRYSGRRSDFRYDIAVLKLKTNAVISNNVDVACVDWDASADGVHLTAGTKGTVVGWGLTNNGPKSSILQWVDLPWVDENTCYNAVSREAQKFLTNDKFCAGYVNKNTSVCRGDSGGGFMVLNPSDNRYYLRGIVSTHLNTGQDPAVCHPQLYTSFTSFADYSGWVKEKMG